MSKTPADRHSCVVSNPSVTGRWGESIAEKYLQEQGYEIVDKNYRCQEGEMDLIAWDEKVLVFIEVKTRRSASFGSPEEAVTIPKQQRLGAIAYSYLKSHELMGVSCRFDVVAIRIIHKNPPQIRLLRGAFFLNE